VVDDLVVVVVDDLAPLPTTIGVDPAGAGATLAGAWVRLTCLGHVSLMKTGARLAAVCSMFVDWCFG
jgi:hypothetical protein